MHILKTLTLMSLVLFVDAAVCIVLKSSLENFLVPAKNAIPYIKLNTWQSQ